jgi:hypothetical protein
MIEMIHGNFEGNYVIQGNTEGNDVIYENDK